MEVFGEALTELAKASPYAIILVIVFYLFWRMYNKGLEAITTHSQTAIKEIKEAHNDASNRLDMVFKLINSK